MYVCIICKHVCVRVRAYVCAPRRRYVTSSHGNQCSWPPTRSHGAKPTRPASFGHLCERASYLSLTLSLFLDLSPASLFLLTAVAATAAAAAAAAAVSARAVSSFFFHPSFLLVRSFIYLPALLREDYPVPAGEISIPSGIRTSKQRLSARSLSRLELVKILYPHLATRTKASRCPFLQFLDKKTGFV